MEFPFDLDVLELCTDDLKQRLMERRRILASREEVRTANQRLELASNSGM